MSSVANTLDFATLEAIGVIRRQLNYSYPYKAGSATINCAGFDKKIMIGIIKYFMECHCSITINYEKKQVKISGYLC